MLNIGDYIQIINPHLFDNLCILEIGKITDVEKLDNNLYNFKAVFEYDTEPKFIEFSSERLQSYDIVPILFDSNGDIIREYSSVVDVKTGETYKVYLYHNNLGLYISPDGNLIIPPNCVKLKKTKFRVQSEELPF